MASAFLFCMHKVKKVYILKGVLRKHLRIRTFSSRLNRLPVFSPCSHSQMFQINTGYLVRVLYFWKLETCLCISAALEKTAHTRSGSQEHLWEAPTSMSIRMHQNACSHTHTCGNIQYEKLTKDKIKKKSCKYSTVSGWGNGLRSEYMW